MLRRVIFANESRLLGEMLSRVIQKVPDLEIVGEIADLTGLSALIERSEAHWVVLPLLDGGEMPGLVEELLDAHPSLWILEMTGDGSLVRTVWQEAEREIVDLDSVSDLVDLLRRGL